LGDPIAGAEALIDEHIVGKALSQREHLGVYAGHVGTTAVVLMPQSDEELQRGSQRGAVIVGLGKMGELSAGKISETVRAGMLRLLMHSHDRSKKIQTTQADKHGREIAVASLLIGYNSTANMTIDDSVAAVVRGVCEANKQYADTMGNAVYVGKLEFIELYRDSAIAAARAVAGLSQRMQRELDALGAVIQGADELREGTGVRERLNIGRSNNYWPQLIITDADRNEEACAPECYRAKWVTPIPEDVVEDLVEGELRRRGIPCPDDKEKPAQAAGQTRKTQRKRLAERLKYIYLSERARAESVVQQRQPGLIEKIIETAIQDDAYKEGLSRTLFQLMVPLDFKAAARDAQRLVLVVDSYTANLPWEMLQIDEKPMVLSTRMVRQFVTGHYRRKVRSVTRKAACIIANPSTAGFATHFGRAGGKSLPDLPGASAEGLTIRNILRGEGYNDIVCPDAGSPALEVISSLFKTSYRILVVSAHGEFELTASDGSLRSGVILSDGMMLTAAEVGQMEAVPELVFLNCCHLGELDIAPAYNKLAYSLARELIEMGVRCVVAAGWRVNDAAARVFAETFFQAFVAHKQTFGDALYTARAQTYEQYPSNNTWGAYQAYGDPSFRLELDGECGPLVKPTYFAPSELLARLDGMRTQIKMDKKNNKFKDTVKTINELLDLVPLSWRDNPEIQYAIACVYAEYGVEGFDFACAAYERAITLEDAKGRLPIKALEQLANLEARTGEKLGGATGLARIEKALSRLQGLLVCTHKVTIVDGCLKLDEKEVSAKVNIEQWSLLASTWKRKAMALAKQEAANWDTVRQALACSSNAYGIAGGSLAANNIAPYPMLNRLQLGALLQEFAGQSTEVLEASAKQCAAIAHQKYATSLDFFDAVMPADAQLTIHMIQGNLPESVDELVKDYRDAVSMVPRSAREFDSVTSQMRILACLYRLQAGAVNDDTVTKTCTESAAALDMLARRISANLASDSGKVEPCGMGAKGDSVASSIVPTDAKTAPAKPAKRPRRPRLKKTGGNTQ
jgi:CHAT domain-containing protein